MTDEGRKLIVFGHKKAADGSWETGIHYAEVDPDDHLAGGTVETEAEVDAHLSSGLEPPYHVFDEKDQARLLTGLCEQLHREADAYENRLNARLAESASAEKAGSEPKGDADVLAIMRQIRDALHGKEIVGALRIAEDQIGEIQLTLDGSELDDRVTEPTKPVEPAEEPSFLRGPQTEYLVRWEIEVDAPSPEKAVRRARAIASRPWEESTIYDVFSEGGNHDRVELFKDGKTVTEPVGKVDEGKAADETVVPSSKGVQ